VSVRGMEPVAAALCMSVSYSSAEHVPSYLLDGRLVTDLA
jgi:hypothetical protein